MEPGLIAHTYNPYPALERQRRENCEFEATQNAQKRGKWREDLGQSLEPMLKVASWCMLVTPALGGRSGRLADQPTLASWQVPSQQENRCVAKKGWILSEMCIWYKHHHVKDSSTSEPQGGQSLPQVRLKALAWPEYRYWWCADSINHSFLLRDGCSLGPFS